MKTRLYFLWSGLACSGLIMSVVAAQQTAAKPPQSAPSPPKADKKAQPHLLAAPTQEPTELPYSILTGPETLTDPAQKPWEDTLRRLKIQIAPGGQRVVPGEPQPFIVESRNLLFTPEDAARVQTFHPLLTPEIMERVKVIPLRPRPAPPARPAEKPAKEQTVKPT
ncbi:MAG TPA: hypothetical protein VFB21_14520 [Chthonomonadaceae bacterium]|nr:hypothetical protein [Chthonomonadaceae bacterium]